MRFTLPAHLFGRRPAATLLAAALLATFAALTHSLLPNGAVSAETDTAGICDRTQEVHEAILDKLTGISDCADVTNSNLFGVTGEIVILDNESISLPDGDFQGLSNLEVLYISHNGLGALPQDVFDGRDKLDRLILTSNNLSGLPEGVFDGLTEIETLYMGNNPGTPFTFKAELEQRGGDVVVKVAEGAPFDMSVTLSVQVDSLSTSMIVSVAGGPLESSPIAIPLEGNGDVTVSVQAASFLE